MSSLNLAAAGDKQQQVAAAVEVSAFQQEEVEDQQESAMETEQIKAALKAAYGTESLTDAQLDELVERQRKLLAGEEVKEEVKVQQKVEEEEKQEVLGLFDVAKIDWNYFSPENAQKVRIQNIVQNAEQARALRDQIIKQHGKFDEITDLTNQALGKPIRPVEKQS